MSKFRKEYRHGTAIDVAIGYVALMDHLIQPSLPPTLAAEYLNTKTKHSQLFPEFPFKSFDITRYRRRIAERNLGGSRRIAESVENNLERWQMRKQLLGLD